MRTPTSAALAQPRVPRVFSHMAPAWALYAMTVFALGALTGLAGWMAQNGVRLIWGMLVALGVGAQVSALALRWQRRAWRNRVQSLPLPAAQQRRVTRVTRRLSVISICLALAGFLALGAGVSGALRAWGQPSAE